MGADWHLVISDLVSFWISCSSDVPRHMATPVGIGQTNGVAEKSISESDISYAWIHDHTNLQLRPPVLRGLRAVAKRCLYVGPSDFFLPFSPGHVHILKNMFTKCSVTISSVRMRKGVLVTDITWAT